MKSFPTLPSYHLCTSIYKYAWTYTAVTWFFCGLTAVSRVTFCAVVHLIHCDRTVIIPCSAKTQILVVEILEVYFMSFTCHVASYIQNRSQASFLVGSSPSRAHLKCCSSLNTSSPGWGLQDWQRGFTPTRWKGRPAEQEKDGSSLMTLSSAPSHQEIRCWGDEEWLNCNSRVKPRQRY